MEMLLLIRYTSTRMRGKNFKVYPFRFAFSFLNQTNNKFQGMGTMHVPVW
uniref:Uncharacterized protein n=1 Tax=Arundo donax TaxID=35708 RepID=A0A0A8ZSI3_ARUDO